MRRQERRFLLLCLTEHGRSRDIAKCSASQYFIRCRFKYCLARPLKFIVHMFQSQIVRYLMLFFVFVLRNARKKCRQREQNRTLSPVVKMRRYRPSLSQKGASSPNRNSIDKNFERVIAGGGKRGTEREAAKRAKRGMAESGDDEGKMEEPVRVAHGRYGCKSAYETYKRFARTNTRPRVRPRRRDREGAKRRGRDDGVRRRGREEGSVPDGFK